MPESSILHKNLSFCPDLTGAKVRKANLSTGNADAVTAKINPGNIKTMVTQMKKLMKMRMCIVLLLFAGVPFGRIWLKTPE